jgi:hypothetical protein
LQLKGDKNVSSTDKLLKELLRALRRHKVEGEVVRVPHKETAQATKLLAAHLAACLKAKAGV